MPALFVLSLALAATTSMAICTKPCNLQPKMAQVALVVVLDTLLLAVCVPLAQVLKYQHAKILAGI